MLFPSMKAFIDTLKQQGDLLEIDREVDPYLEISEISHRFVKEGGPALLFKQVKGADFPLAQNLFASPDRISLALGVSHPDEIGERIRNIIRQKTPQGFSDKLSLFSQLLEAAKFPPKQVKHAPVQEVVRTGKEASLDTLPVITCWPRDGGAYFTLPQVITEDPETGIRNVGMYRMQKFDATTTGMHWQQHKHGASHFVKYRNMGKKMPVCVALGGPPVLTYASTAPLPENIDEYLFAGFLQKNPVRLVKSITTDLMVPADADFILEGYVDPGEAYRTEGPFGDHTGFYSLEDDYPVFHITAITHRKEAVYPSTIVGVPPMEDYWLGYATERIFLPLAQMMMPEIRDYHMPPEGVFHNLVFVSIKKQYPGHAYKVMQGLWGLGLMMLAKVIVVLDDDVNVQKPSEAWWTALNHIDPERDILFTRGPLDDLDHASRLPSFGSKMGIDGTRKTPEEGFTRRWPDKITMHEDVISKVNEYFPELLKMYKLMKNDKTGK
ncbi:MAG: UbiD family decarboxylase [Marinimicrobia bacterium 46_43]|nr:MAG: UbiD family decarboxylase [Marinimicrobia bacterium 46_43]HBY17766.1 menaquinone biosynthesis decarboxylase [Candidatus Neomarinimicrobiota bacterium]